LPRTPLPQPEADYELKVGETQKKASAWIAPGVLLRADAAPEPSPPDEAGPAPTPAAPPSTPVRATPEPTDSAPKPKAVAVDLELVRAAATELQALQAIRQLLQTVAAWAVHATSDEAKRALDWTAAARQLLYQHDPVASLMRLALELSPELMP